MPPGPSITVMGGPCVGPSAVRSWSISAARAVKVWVSAGSSVGQVRRGDRDLLGRDGQVETRVLGQDGLVQPAQLGSGFEAELGDHDLTGGLVDGERL